MEEKSYNRYTTSADGTRTLRYRAIDPADDAMRCTCGKPGCTWARFLPFRDHITRLHDALSQIASEELAVSEPHGWMGALYGLRIAASIEDVEADTGFVENPEVFALCETTIDYENAQSEMASKYVAGAAIFNFLWLAYEAAVSETASAELVRLQKEKRLGERGRRIFESRNALSARFHGLSEVVRAASCQCRNGERMDARLDALLAKFPGYDLVAAAELVREFRNFLFHGEDEVPHHEDWGDSTISRCRLYRFYSVSRLLLYLIQACLWIEVGESNNSMQFGFSSRSFQPRQWLERLQFRDP